MKKVFALLMALVLVISAVPLMASATTDDSTPDHDCTQHMEVQGPATGETHYMKCGICGTENVATVNCDFSANNDGSCWCGNKQPAPPAPDHDCTQHMEIQGPATGETHYMKCGKCGKENVEILNCDFTAHNGSCWCGNTCSHTGLQDCEPIDGTHHKVVCHTCKKVLVESIDCDFSTGACACENTCPHIGVQDCEPIDGTHHKVVCHTCKKVLVESIDCDFSTGACACENTCPHIGVQECIPIDGTHHKVVCSTCKEVIENSIECDFSTGECACTNKKACNHEGAQHLSTNDDGKTHDALCAKCYVVMAKNIPCVKQANGKCACGRDMTCKHQGQQSLIPNSDGKTHNAYCTSCGELMAQKITCVKQANGKCACGRVMTTSTTPDPTLDNVPKTSDLLAPVAVLSGLMSTVGLVIKKRYF